MHCLTLLFNFLVLNSTLTGTTWKVSLRLFLDFFPSLTAFPRTRVASKEQLAVDFTFHKEKRMWFFKESQTEQYQNKEWNKIFKRDEIASSISFSVLFSFSRCSHADDDYGTPPNEFSTQTIRLSRFEPLCRVKKKWKSHPVDILENIFHVEDCSGVSWK